jgi:hypothetical protein
LPSGLNPIALIGPASPPNNIGASAPTISAAEAQSQHWPATSLLDMLKEVDLRIHFTEQFVAAGAREHLDRLTLQKRLQLCLYALGTNTGLKRMSGGEHSHSYKDLLYVHRRFCTAPRSETPSPR